MNSGAFPQHSISAAVGAVTITQLILRCSSSPSGLIGLERQPELTFGKVRTDSADITTRRTSGARSGRPASQGHTLRRLPTHRPPREGERSLAGIRRAVKLTDEEVIPAIRSSLADAMLFADRLWYKNCQNRRK